MKLYGLSYDFYLYTINSGCEPIGIENRKEYFDDICTFIDRIKHLTSNNISILSGGNEYIKNIRTFSGELQEISLEKVLNPF